MSMNEEAVDKLRESLRVEIEAAKQAREKVSRIVGAIAKAEVDIKAAEKTRINLVGAQAIKSEQNAPDLDEVEKQLEAVRLLQVDQSRLIDTLGNDRKKAEIEQITLEGRLNGMALSKVRSLRGAYIDQIQENAAAILRIWKEWQGFVDEAQRALGVSLYEYDRDLHKLNPGMPDFVDFMKSLHPQFISV